MTMLPRRLNSAQCDENCQKCPKLTFKRPATSIFVPNLEKNAQDIGNERTKLHRKNAGNETLIKNNNKGSPC